MELAQGCDHCRELVLDLNLGGLQYRNVTLKCLTLYVPCIVTNYVNKPTRCTFSMYLFYNLYAILHDSNDHVVHHQEFTIYRICSSVQTMQTCRNCSVLRFNLLYLHLCTNRKTEQLDTFAWFVQSCRYSKLWTPDDEWHGRSKHVELYKNCRINTYRKCILLICLSNLKCLFCVRFQIS